MHFYVVVRALNRRRGARRFLISSLAVGTLLVSILGGCSGSSQTSQDLLSQIKQRGVLKVGTFTIPPEAWVDTNSGEWKGIDAEFAGPIAKKLGVKIEPVLLDHAALVPSITSGRVDMIAALYKTPERAKTLKYNQEPAWCAGDIVVTSDSNKSINSFTDLKSKTIGVVRASAQEIAAKKLEQEDGATVKEYESADPMLLDVKAGRVDAAIWWSYTYDYALQKNPQYGVHKVGVIPPQFYGMDKYQCNYYVFPKKASSDSLIQVVDEVTKSIKSDGTAKSILAGYGLTGDSYLTGTP